MVMSSDAILLGQNLGWGIADLVSVPIKIPNQEVINAIDPILNWNMCEFLKINFLFKSTFWKSWTIKL